MPRCFLKSKRTNVKTIYSEKLLDDKLVKAIKARGGIALKMICLSFTGLPDRWVLLPGGRIYFVELKTTGKKLSPRQEVVIPWLRNHLGFTVFVVDDQLSLDNCLNIIDE